MKKYKELNVGDVFYMHNLDQYNKCIKLDDNSARELGRINYIFDIDAEDEVIIDIDDEDKYYLENIEKAVKAYVNWLRAKGDKNE